MPTITTPATNIEGSLAISHAANATTTATDYTFQYPQDSITLFNLGLRPLSVLVNGIRHTVDPYKTAKFLNATNVNIKSFEQTVPFRLEGRADIANIRPTTRFMPALTSMTLSSTFAAVSGLGYYKDEFNRVYVQGGITHTALPALGSTIFTFPTGFRPAQLVMFNGVQNDTGDLVLSVDTAGVLKWVKGGTVGQAITHANLSNINFRAV